MEARAQGALLEVSGYTALLREAAMTSKTEIFKFQLDSQAQLDARYNKPAMGYAGVARSPARRLNRCSTRRRLPPSIASCSCHRHRRIVMRSFIAAATMLCILSSPVNAHIQPEVHEGWLAPQPRVIRSAKPIYQKPIYRKTWKHSRKAHRKVARHHIKATYRKIAKRHGRVVYSKTAAHHRKVYRKAAMHHRKAWRKVAHHRKVAHLRKAALHRKAAVRRHVYSNRNPVQIRKVEIALPVVVIPAPPPPPPPPAPPTFAELVGIALQTLTPIQDPPLPPPSPPPHDPPLPVKRSKLEPMSASDVARIVELDDAREYLVETAVQGNTMVRQGANVAIGRLHPQFAIRLARAIREARANGLPNAAVYSAYRPPAFGVGGFSDKFNSMHAYGLAVDMCGIGRPGSKETLKWFAIAGRNKIFNPYGPYHRAEWNHYQPTFTRKVAGGTALRTTITSVGPKDEERMWHVAEAIIRNKVYLGDPPKPRRSAAKHRVASR